MAQIWIDSGNSMNNIVVDNSVETFRFIWQFVTFSGETQEKARVRWRKGGYANYNIRQISEFPEDIWPAANMVEVSKLPLPNGFNITNIEFPIGKLTPGVWVFQVNMFQTGASDWSGWSGNHRIEITPYDERQLVTGVNGTSSSIVKGPHGQTEGAYAARVEVISTAGISALSSETPPYNTWETNRYIMDSGGNLKAVPEWVNDGTRTKRIRRA